ncbi:MAG: 2-oxoglutarate dehydrogenase E1 component, partial [Chloroflexia bacterium]|nr:2-oxoglutarate dehydrogenase E1 component [Chloroflexia bacterium]
MGDLRAFFGPNAGYVLELYDRYQADPQSVDDESRQFFDTFTPTSPEPTRSPNGAAAPETSAVDVRKVAAAVGLANGIREYGHLAVRLDPLGSERDGAPELVAETYGIYGITEDDLAGIPAAAIDGPLAEGAATAAEAIAHLREAYTTAIGFDFDH